MTTVLRRISPALALLIATACMDTPAGTADLVLRGGVVWTGAETGVVRAVAIENGRVAAVGSDRQVSRWIGEGTEVIELEGRSVTPGIIDSHTHFLSGGFQLSSVQLRDADSRGALARRISRFTETVAPGTWITGGDWDHERWGGELPHRRWIDRFTAEHPVFVVRLDGHMGLANSLALQAAGIDAGGTRTPDPAGGTIERDPETGEPTGVLKDTAMELVFAAIPPSSEDELDAALDAAAAHALSRGVTQVHDMATFESLATYRRALEQDRLPLRVYSVVPLSQWEAMAELVEAEGRGDDHLWWGGLKGFVDGSLGSTTAWFYEPYEDEPETSGLITTDTTSMKEWIVSADSAGLHVMIHAIGDRANDWLLDQYAALSEVNGERDRRLRIEHAQHLSADAIGRFAELGVIASMQPYHAADDGRWAEKRIGADRIRTTYAFRSLLDAGATVAFGSDWTVAPIDPTLGFDAAVTRRTLDGANPQGWVPGERVSLEETLVAYTSAGARAAFRDNVLGTLGPGMLADLVVYSTDLFELTPEEIGDADVDFTLVGGEVVYEHGGAR